MPKPAADVKVKICGNTNLKDALLAVEAGADALGFIFYRKSPRFVSMQTVKQIVQVLPPFVETVGVFVDETAERINRIAETCKLDAVQLHGKETPAFCRRIRRKVIKAVRVENAASLKGLDRYPVSGFLLDAWSEKAPGGTGETFDWNWVHRGKKFGPVILAGGLTPANVRQAVKRVQPYAVDVCSGVEKSLGVKDPDKVRAFVIAANKG